MEFSQVKLVGESLVEELDICFSHFGDIDSLIEANFYSLMCE